jgi:hypothetical protein
VAVHFPRLPHRLSTSCGPTQARFCHLWDTNLLSNFDLCISISHQRDGKCPRCDAGITAACNATRKDCGFSTDTFTVPQWSIRVNRYRWPCILVQIRARKPIILPLAGNCGRTTYLGNTHTRTQGSTRRGLYSLIKTLQNRSMLS